MKYLFAVVCLWLLGGCTEEKIEEIQTNIIVQAMTDGQWKVVKYLKGSTDVSADFNLYKFQFRANNKVEAILVANNSVENTGSWSADASARTITSQFSNAGTTLSLLNGTWKITKNSWTYVEAEQNLGSQTHFLRLEKL